LENVLQGIDIESMRPIDALMLLDQLKKGVSES